MHSRRNARNARNAIARRITEWFHTEGDTPPAHWINNVVERFLKQCRKHGLSLYVTESHLHTLFCEAVCVMHHAHITHKDWSGPKRLFPIPEYWNDSTEQLWIDYIHGRVFTYEFWESFWYSVKEASWEHSIPSFRANIQCLLPFYIRRSNDILVKEGDLVEHEDGLIVTAEEHEYADDGWYY